MSEQVPGASASADQALIASDQAPAGLVPSGFDPSRDADYHFDDEGFYDDSGRWWPNGAEWCDRCQGMGTEECLCAGDFCCCGRGEIECMRCDGEGYFVPTAAFRAARVETARWWAELHASLEAIGRDSDRSGEAGETRSGSTEGESAGPKGIAQGDPS
jgi:hypothetical protein